MKRILVLFMLLVAAAAPTFAQDYEVEALEIELDDFTTQAELTYPGEGTYPTVILIHGSGPFDLDATSVSTTGETLSTNFRLLAERLPEQGIAVLRYNKRGVLGGGEYDLAQVQASTLDQLVEDANRVVDAALELPQVESVYLWGWSEGGVVAANVAAGRDDIAGLILQGAPNGSVGDVLPYQHLELGIPYLTDVTDADGDGLLSPDEISTLPASSVGLMASFYMLAFGSTPENPQLNPQTDSNNDGLIDIENELRPAVENLIEIFPNFLPQGEASWEVGELLAAMDIPVLVLQGENDGWVPLAMAEALYDASPDNVTLSTYPDLGHALSEVENPAEDVFLRMEDAPIEDAAAWINAQ